MTQETDQTLIFLHIPKAAGTTLNHIIDRQYSTDQIYAFGPMAQESIEAYKQMSEVERGCFRVIRGHMGFGLHQWVPGPSTYFTMLRNPIDRVISFHYYVRQIQQHYLYSYPEFKDMDLKDLVESRLTVMVDNGQTRMLSGVWQEAGFGECDEAMLAQAKYNLRHYFSVVGLTEQFDKSLVLLKRTFGWENTNYKKHNVTERRPHRNQLPPDTIEVLRETNRLDFELYEYARELFQEQIATQGMAFYTALVQQRVQNCDTNRSLCKLYWQMRKVSIRTMIAQGIRRLQSSDEQQ